MVITLRHNKTILSTGFEGDFPLTLRFYFATFSFSLSLLLNICHFEALAEQLLEMLLT